MRIPTITLLLCLLSAALIATAEVPRSRLEKLSRGANITQWFQVYSPKPDSHYRDYISDDEIALIRRLGLRHVRLCFSPQFLYDPADPEHPTSDHFSMIEEGIRRLNKHGLAVVLDPHNSDQKRIEGEGEWSAGFPRFWGALASRLKLVDPEMLFFEVVNEPVFDGNEAKWFALQERIVSAIRTAAPRHTIIATGPNWGGVDGLKKMAPMKDGNVVYSFHFYDPFTFTHQGSTWSGPIPPYLNGVPYPSSPELVADVLARTENEGAKGWIKDYGNKRWDRERLKSRLAEALAWGREHKVPLYCGEFGVFPKNAPPESRKNWFRDFASVLKESGVGWAVWGWDDGFGFGRRLVDGKPVIDPVPVQSLGLNKP
jgi:endoglucanase